MKLNQEVTWHPKDTYRTFSLWAIAVVVFASVSIVNLGVSVAAVKESTTTGFHLGWLAAILAVVVVIVLPVTLLIRLSRAAVVVRTGGIVLRNVLSTKEFAWGEIDRFAFGVEHWTIFHRAAALHTTDGREFTVWAIQSPTWFGSAENEKQMVDELNTRLDSAKASNST